MAKGISYEELTQIIGQLHRKKRNGTLFLRTEDNHSGMIFFSAGTVTGVTCGVLRGRRAIAALRGVSRFSLRFDEGRPPPVRQDLLSPEETLMEFGVGSAGAAPTEPPPLAPTAETAPTPAPRPRPAAPPTPTPAPAPVTSPRPAPMPATAPAPSTGFQLALDNLLRHILTEEMTNHLGPAGGTLVSDAERHAGGMRSQAQVECITGYLGQELADTGEQDVFLRDVRIRIGTLFTKAACELITNELVEYLGPVAPSICDDTVRRLGGSITSPMELEAVVSDLAREIDDRAEAAEFLAKVEDALSGLANHNG